jgi:hypothetical protein
MSAGEVWSTLLAVSGGWIALAYARDASWLRISGWRWVPLWLVVLGVYAGRALTQPVGWRHYGGWAVCACLLVGLVRRLKSVGHDSEVLETT